MPDFIDNTVEREEMILNSRIRQMLGQNQMVRKSSLSHCHYCEGSIPLARQQAIKGCQCCVACQTLKERGFTL